MAEGEKIRGNVGGNEVKEVLVVKGTMEKISRLQRPR